MSLDPPKSDAELLAMLAQKQGRVGYVRVEGTPPNPPATLTTTQPTTWSPATPLAYYRPAEWPIALRIPWSALISDDAKYAPALRKGKPVLILTEAYREAKARMAALATDVMAGRPAITEPLAFVARVWVPNNHRRDVQNFSKCCLDAMSKVVYADDSLLHDTRWIRAGVDVDAPRAEIVISPLAASSP